MKISGTIKGKCKIEVPYLVINIKNSDETNAILFSSRISHVEIFQFENSLEFSIHISQLNLVAGIYNMDIKLLTLGGKRIATWAKAYEFSIEPPTKYGNISLPSTYNRGIVYIDPNWEIKTT